MEQKQTLYNPFILGKNIFQYMIYNIHLFIYLFLSRFYHPLRTLIYK